jgi:hypothetical protein
VPLKNRNAITKADFEEALDYLGSSVSEVAKQTNIPRAYLSDLKNRNVRLRREHEEKLRTFLQDQDVELESDAPAGRRDPANKSSPHPAVEVAQVIRRSLTLDDTLDDDAIAAALKAQADRDARLSQLFAMKIKQADNSIASFFDGDDDTKKSKQAIDEARRLLAESYIAVGILRGLRGFKSAAPEGEPQTLGELLTKEHADALEAAGLIESAPEPTEPSARQEPAPAAKPGDKKPEPKPASKSSLDEFFSS